MFIITKNRLPKTKNLLPRNLFLELFRDAAFVSLMSGLLESSWPMARPWARPNTPKPLREVQALGSAAVVLPVDAAGPPCE